MDPPVVDPLVPEEDPELVPELVPVPVPPEETGAGGFIGLAQNDPRSGFVRFALKASEAELLQ